MHSVCWKLFNVPVSHDTAKNRCRYLPGLMSERGLKHLKRPNSFPAHHLVRLGGNTGQYWDAFPRLSKCWKWRETAFPPTNKNTNGLISNAAMTDLSNVLNVLIPYFFLSILKLLQKQFALFIAAELFICTVYTTLNTVNFTLLFSLSVSDCLCWLCCICLVLNNSLSKLPKAGAKK